MKEGVIKFKLHREETIPAIDSELIKQRNRLRKASLIGVDAGNFGYGNISVRRDKGFLISGSQTGALLQAEARHFSEVLRWNFTTNELWSCGLIDASSESLTHAMLYELSTDIQAVVHIHHDQLWQNTLHHWPTTPDKSEYGSVQMAEAVRRLWNQDAFTKVQAITMGGHKSGILAFGSDLKKTCDFLIEAIKGVFTQTKRAN